MCNFLDFSLRKKLNIHYPGKRMPAIKKEIINIRKKQLKKEIVDVFQKHGYLTEGKDCEILLKLTSGNIAWINIKSIEIIK